MAERRFGKAMALKIHLRIRQLVAADDVGILMSCRIGRCHMLRHDRAGQYSMDLEQPYRLVFTVERDVVQVANVIEIVDYH